MVPHHIYHYYDESTGPLLNISDLSITEAERIQRQFSHKTDFKCSQRPEDYIRVRLELESKLREMFIAAGGKPSREHPHYFTLGPCSWLLSWYPSPLSGRIRLSSIPSEAISFTYGDLFPAMRFNDGASPSGHVYRAEELTALISAHGLPQEENPEGKRAEKIYRSTIMG